MATVVGVNPALPNEEPKGMPQVSHDKLTVKKPDSTNNSQLSSAEQQFTTHTPPASDGSHNGDDASNHQHTTHSDTAKDVDDGSSELSELDFDNDGNPDPVMEGIESLDQTKDDVYTNIQPAEWSGKIPIFRPNMDQFADFEKFMNAINHYGMQSGIVLVDPPQDWNASRPPLDEHVKTVQNRRPIKQEFVKYGSVFGCFKQQNIEKQRNYNLPQWRSVCDDVNHQPPAPRGQARTAAGSKPAKPAPPKSKAPPLPLAPGQKRRAGRPRVHAVKEEETPSTPHNTESGIVGPPTPTSPKLEPEDGSDGEVGDAEKGNAPKRRKGRPAKSAKAPKAKRAPKTNDSSGDKTTSVAARRQHNEGAAVHEVDEEAFKGFDYRIHNHDEYTSERCAELERKYWQGLMYADPMYGADMPGSLFDEKDKVWNVANLPNLLDVVERKIPGVNTAYLYLGMWKATFAWHLEDMDLYSINYIHFGAPKQWYSISQKDLPKFEAVMRELFPQDAKNCDQFLRHKSFLVSPELLEKRGIQVNRLVHREGQFVITYPMGYHSGYNLGYNCAESVNFALDHWLKFAEKAKKCECESDSVFIDFAWLMRRINKEPTPEFDYEEVEISDDEDADDAQADLPTPPKSTKGQTKAGQKRKRGPAAKEKKKKKIRIAIKKHQPCVLCPNDFDWEPLMPTAEGKMAHRRCAESHLETYICEQDGKDTVFGINNINKERSKLRCSYCHISRGTCFQCHSAKCTKPFHGTCAVLAGVQIDKGESCFPLDGVDYKSPVVDLRCKLHRTVKSNARDESHAQELDAMPVADNVYDFACKLKENDVVQFQRIKGDDVRAAIVKAPLQKGDKTILVEVLPKRYALSRTDSNMSNLNSSNIVSLLDIDSLLFVDESTSSFHPPLPTAIPLPPNLAHELLGSSTPQSNDDNKKPTAGDTFWDSIEGSQKLEWAEFSDLAPAEQVKNTSLKKIKFSDDPEKEGQLFHYLPASSTETKDVYYSNPKTKVADSRANPDSIPRHAIPTSTPSNTPKTHSFTKPYQPKIPASAPTPPAATSIIPTPLPKPNPYVRTPMASGPRPYPVAPNAHSYNGPVFPYSPLNTFTPSNSPGPRPMQKVQPPYAPTTQTPTSTFQRQVIPPSYQASGHAITAKHSTAGSAQSQSAQTNGVYSSRPSYLPSGSSQNIDLNRTMPQPELRNQGSFEQRTEQSQAPMLQSATMFHTDQQALQRVRQFQSGAIGSIGGDQRSPVQGQLPAASPKQGHNRPWYPVQGSANAPIETQRMNHVRAYSQGQPEARPQSGSQTQHGSPLQWQIPNVMDQQYPSGSHSRVAGMVPASMSMTMPTSANPPVPKPTAQAMRTSQPTALLSGSAQNPLGQFDGSNDATVKMSNVTSAGPNGSRPVDLKVQTPTSAGNRSQGNRRESGKWVRDWLDERSPEQKGEILGEGGPGLPSWWGKPAN
ncbi:MAG: hypothetical protein Q9227_004552 [Pyrenula ochraceoflavens]